MPLTIQTTGLEQYGAGGEGRLQVMIIGGPGAGKTRFASYWPRPIYANCEAGLASIADRKMPFVTIKKSQDMLDLLSHLALECRRPYQDRQYQTVVVDTIDAFQRAVKDEWLQANPGAQSFRGFEAWGYLDAKMQMLLTRLLNLDMNVVVLAHYKDKTIKEGQGENASERQELMLQLSGEVKDSIFNDFDLVGWMGTFWDVEEGQRVEKRGLTFKRTPDKPFLKDRLNVTPPWMEVSFSPEDYDQLFIAVISRLDEFAPSESVGEIAPSGPEGAIPTGGVVGPLSGGPVNAPAPTDVPLMQFDKPTLQKMARDLGVDFKANWLKTELAEAIEKKRAEKGTAAPESDAAPASGGASAQAPTQGAASPDGSAVPDIGTPGTAEPPPADGDASDASATDVVSDIAAASEADTGTPLALEDLAASAVATPAVATEAGEVDPATGEILAPALTEEQVADALGGSVVSTTEEVEDPSVATAQAPPAPATAAACEVCNKDLTGENQDYVKLAFIKFRKRLCNEHYLAAKRG